MSNAPSPGTLIEETDPVALKAIIKAKRTAFAARSETYIPDPNLTDAENEAEKMLYDEETARLCREQIGLVMKLRGVTSAPKKKTTKPPKKTINFDEFDADILNAS